MNAGTQAPLLEVEGLSVTFPTRTRVVQAVRDISFSVGREKVGIVGESGSGKTMTGRAVLGLIRPPGIATARRMTFDGIDLTGLSEKQYRSIRGNRIAMRSEEQTSELQSLMRNSYAVYCLKK